jgi:sporadic carbohydrate cluster 2OG-Fe(II) oxygenase
MVLEGDFAKQGYVVVSAEDQSGLDAVRDKIFESARRPFADAGNDPVTFFDNFHARGMTGAALNEYRMRVINEVTAELDVGACIYRAFESSLRTLIGPDVVVQRGTNIVIQQPGDIDVSPVHRDAPANSHFEVVVWAPFVSCFGTKGMSVVSPERSSEALALLADGDRGFEAFTEFSVKNSTPIEIDYGQALIFWTGLVHAVPVNREPSTRWSMNIRYKNFFSPYGHKGLPDFFRILRLSPLTEIAVKAEQRELARPAARGAKRAAS